MDTIIATIVSLGMIVGGTVMYFVGAKKSPRTTLAVPLLSDNGKMMAGGTLVFAGLCVAAVAFLHGSR